jgi:hypothetical protein
MECHIQLKLPNSPLALIPALLLICSSSPECYFPIANLVNFLHHLHMEGYLRINTRVLAMPTED